MKTDIRQRILEIIKKYPNQFYNISFWKLTINKELNNKCLTMSSSSIGKILGEFCERKILIRSEHKWFRGHGYKYETKKNNK